ncbi:MAG: saccharopine dehydrogenase NADP-binding domain-containing protein [Actinomycetota bacterium]|nr:saccharopine dehydrogenase NADP-binding domain-containing protein [Actinomycetota bacterium]
MADVGLVGASGYTGRLVARALDRRGVRFIAAGRDPERVRAAVEGLDHVVGIRGVDITHEGALSALCAEVEVLATTVGPYVELGRPVLEAAVTVPCHYLDASGEQPFLRWAFHSQGARAAEVGVSAVVACGFWGILGDLLAHLAAAALPEALEVHIAYLVRGAGSMASRGSKTTMARLLGGRGYAFVDGHLAEEGLAEARRHAWFPQPVGPRYAAGIPGTEPLTVPRHLPEVRLVRSYLALPGPLVEITQLIGNVTRWEPVRAVVARLLESGPEGPSESRRRSLRWACVAEANGQPGRVARAWAYGRDAYGLTAEAMAAVAVQLNSGLGGATGVVAPAEAVDPASLLDDLSDATDLRWSVRLPTSEDASARPRRDESARPRRDTRPPDRPRQADRR